jgi:hypothetical protein
MKKGFRYPDWMCVRLQFFPVFLERAWMRTCIWFAEICASGLTVGAVLRIGIRCLFDPWIRDLGWVKKQDPDPESGSETNYLG